jgi:hypothetical protein
VDRLLLARRCLMVGRYGTAGVFPYGGFQRHLRGLSDDVPPSREHAGRMDPKAASLLRRFVDKLGGEVQVAVRRGSGRSEHWESFTEVQETVTGFDAEQGVVELERRDAQAVRLHFDETQLLNLLEGAGADGTAAWGEPLSDEEAAARFLTVHLEESLAWDSAHESGWWTYEGARFLPEPPWETHQRRHQG